MTDSWEEKLAEGAYLRLEVGAMLHEIRSEHQLVELFETATFGRVLGIDGNVQTSECDEFFYHEMMSHVPILAHGAVRQVLIVGGGDGGMLEEVLKHRGVERVTQVDIDRTVIDLSRRYLRSICGAAFEDPRTDLIIDDGARFVAQTRARFDVIIVDSPDPVGTAQVLFGAAFYAGCRRCLAPGGVVVTQNGCPFIEGHVLQGTIRHLRPLFADARCYFTTVPSYLGGELAIGWASDDPALAEVALEVLQDRYRAAGIATRYYNPAVHRAAFAIPNYVAALLAEA